ncbi:uncharacterized protein B0P05DRAFT_575439 [Gilbertella persicaria]|uniref:uncharacterized protein n=1 Tax=Gilbertella persicaria TaxID=101096 RepID=UPI00221EBA59|nr:uncharacterized protein B0P05DRAFT_575439 [Gilbertella persicaria]KAI8054201.1 hypothetical protein B0P05DRAFT_575439 [Gilbertella persicaria]
MLKTVRFHPIDTIIMTYSADEYDRSCFASASPIKYVFRPAQQTPVVLPVPIQTNNTTKPVIKPLDLSMIPNSRRRVIDSPIQEANHVNNKTKRPKLSINTQSLTPLFFSGLSTHYKYKNEDEEEEHGFLIPVLAC